MAGLPPRDYLIEEYTRTVCPHCFAERTRRSDEEGVFVIAAFWGCVSSAGFWLALHPNSLGWWR